MMAATTNIVSQHVFLSDFLFITKAEQTGIQRIFKLIHDG